MPTAVPDTGHGSSITFGTTGGTWKCRTISGLEKELPAVNTSYLATSTNETCMPGDLNTLGDITIEILFQGTQGLPATGTVETITHTHPLPGGGAAVAANIAGTGFIRKVKYPDMKTNELQIAQIVFRWDGGTGPTYTATT